VEGYPFGDEVAVLKVAGQMFALDRGAAEHQPQV
jgi:predicted DNA-binding protein (MmcQ/YjbR family)